MQTLNVMNMNLFRSNTSFYPYLIGTYKVICFLITQKFLRQKMFHTLPPLKTSPYLLNVQVACQATSEFINYSQLALIWYQNYLVPKGVLRKSLLRALAHGLYCLERKYHGCYLTSNNTFIYYLWR